MPVCNVYVSEPLHALRAVSWKKQNKTSHGNPSKCTYVLFNSQLSGARIYPDTNNSPWQYALYSKVCWYMATVNCTGHFCICTHVSGCWIWHSSTLLLFRMYFKPQFWIMQGKVKIALYLETHRASYNMFFLESPSRRPVLCLACQTVCNKHVSILVIFVHFVRLQQIC